MEDKSVPEIKPDINPQKICGIDVGLKEFLVTSDNDYVTIPQFASRSEKRLKLLNKNLSRKKHKGTNNRAKVSIKLSLHHQKVACQRRDFHFKVAKKLLKKYNVIANKDLNVKGLVKTRLAKSILDAGNRFGEVKNGEASYNTNNPTTPTDNSKKPPHFFKPCLGWTQFTSILTFKAAKAGLLVESVNPRGTSQRHCSSCGVKVPKTLNIRVHNCPQCLLEINRDLNAAINIRNSGEGHPVLKASGVRTDGWTMKEEAPTN